MRFFVGGIPAPKGSARAFYVPKLGRAVVTAANAKTRPWEQAVRAEASIAGLRPLDGAVRVEVTFLFARPAGHFGAKGLRPSAPREHTKKPDVDKLVRAVLDALTGVAFKDDAQVVAVEARKRYLPEGAAEDLAQPGAWVAVEACGETDARAMPSLAGAEGA